MRSKNKTGISNGELGDPFMATVRMRWCREQRYYDRILGEVLFQWMAAVLQIKVFIIRFIAIFNG